MTNRIWIIRITKHCQRNMWLQIYLTVTKSTICLQNILRLGLFGGPRKSLTATKFNNLTSLHFHISFFFVSVASIGFPAGIVLPRPPTCAALRLPPHVHIVFFISTFFHFFYFYVLLFFFCFFFWVCQWAFDRTHEPHKDIFMSTTMPYLDKPHLRTFLSYVCTRLRYQCERPRRPSPPEHILRLGILGGPRKSRTAH